ncbi:MAG: SpoIID/LytB domain-containing protein [Planctomycetes bacterium]|nr:SpoIID/LytB domain-containing protein [Planctomycetota bacterium]
MRLSQFESRAELEVRGAARAPTRIVRRGEQVIQDGGAPVDAVKLNTRTTMLEIGERRFRGSLEIRARRGAPGLEVTNVLDLEDYVAGVVAREVVLWTCELESLRAQAIASRSYAVAALDERGRKRSDPYLVSDVRDQAYEGVFVPRNARERELVETLSRALESTRGIVLLEERRVVDARFHAACGGATANARDVFPEAPFECLRSVTCPACSGQLASAREAQASIAWKWTAPRDALERVAREWNIGNSLQRLRTTRTDAAGRWLEVELSGERGSARGSFEKLRRSLGADKLPSSRITRTWPREGETLENGLLFEGRGRGHGVGLCQEAARDCARAGWSAERILAHFYPGAELADFR